MVGRWPRLCRLGGAFSRRSAGHSSRRGHPHRRPEPTPASHRVAGRPGASHEVLSPAAHAGHAALSGRAACRTIPLRRSSPLRFFACGRASQGRNRFRPESTQDGPALDRHPATRRAPCSADCKWAKRRCLWLRRGTHGLAGAGRCPGGAHGVVSFAAFLLPGGRVRSARPAHMPLALTPTAALLHRRGNGRRLRSASLSTAGQGCHARLLGIPPGQAAPASDRAGRCCPGLCASSRCSDAAFSLVSPQRSGRVSSPGPAVSPRIPLPDPIRS